MAVKMDMQNVDRPALFSNGFTQAGKRKDVFPEKGSISKEIRSGRGGLRDCLQVFDSGGLMCL
jgi:hypothetical protein